MSPEQWQRVKDIFSDALEVDVQLRRDFVRERAAGDAVVEREVLRLLEAQSSSADFIVEPAVASLSPLIPLSDEQPPWPRLGCYNLVRKIGSGSVASVYEAERCDGMFKRRVALKVLHNTPFLGTNFARFQRECQILADLAHPCICRLFDCSRTPEGLPFSILELVAGNRIDKHCDDARLDIARRLGLFVQLCDAVQCLHEHGFLHSDLKPANVLVEAHNVVRLVDFDSAVPFSAASHESKTVPQQEIAGLTLSYASPEAHQGLRLTPASDVYSLGVVLYELLVEASPHRSEGNLLNQLADSVLYDTPDSPSKAVLQGISERPSDLEAVALRRRTTARQLADGFSGDLDNIVLTALEKNPSKRYRSVSEFSSDLQAYIAGKHVRASTLRAENDESESAPRRLTCRLRTFLSYATDDRPQVHGLYKRLKSVNAEPWMDIEDLLPGQKWETWVKDAIRRVEIALVCLSPRSVTKVGYIQKELRYILDRAAEQPENKTFLIPVRLEDCDIPENLKHWQWVNLYERNGFDKLVRALQEKCDESNARLT